MLITFLTSVVSDRRGSSLGIARQRRLPRNLKLKSLSSQSVKSDQSEYQEPWISCLLPTWFHPWEASHSPCHEDYNTCLTVDLKKICTHLLDVKILILIQPTMHACFLTKAFTVGVGGGLRGSWASGVPRFQLSPILLMSCRKRSLSSLFRLHLLSPYHLLMLFSTRCFLLLAFSHILTSIWCCIQMWYLLKNVGCSCSLFRN